MIGLREQKSRATQTAPHKVVLTARRRRQLPPSFFHVGPVTLCIISVLLIGLMAVFYLSQVGQAVAANQQLQDIAAQQAVLNRQDQDLVESIAQEQSPEYIADNARKLGLILVDPKLVQVLVIKHLLPFNDSGQDFQP